MNPYQKLFLAYITDMRKSAEAANNWWDSVLEAEKAVHKTRAKAEESAGRRWPFGPSSHPFVLATYRKYFLACEALNESVEEGGAVILDDFANESMWGREEDAPPEDDLDAALAGLDVEGPIEPWQLLVESLPNRADDVAEFLEDMVFSPIGLDEHEHSV